MEEEDNLAETLEEVGDIANDLGDIVDAAVGVKKFFSSFLPKDRECSVEISNQCSSYILRNPSVFNDTGVCKTPLTLSIKPSSCGEGLFTKSPYGLRGAAGVLTYNLYDPDTNQYLGKMAALYKVPFDLNLKSIVFAIGFFEMDTKCDKRLFESMFSKTEDTFVRAKANGSSIEFESELVDISASMSNSGKAVLKIEVTDK
ncbi:unnamed protein product [Knipowitschia caucasica]